MIKKLGKLKTMKSKTKGGKRAVAKKKHWKKRRIETEGERERSHHMSSRNLSRPVSAVLISAPAVTGHEGAGSIRDFTKRLFFYVNKKFENKCFFFMSEIFIS